jgi:DNA-binding PadR family transcriptional regulator
MPKPFPIRIEVEEFALGAVLRRLHEMQGVAKVDLLLGHAERKALPGDGHGAQDIVLAALMNGPKHRKELAELVGGSMSRLYGAINQLKRKRMIKVVGAATYGLAKATYNGKPLALPAPKKKGPKGKRAVKGASTAAMIAILAQQGPKRPIEIQGQLSEHGVSGKSLSGVLHRAKRDGIVKNANGVYSLTARAMKQQAAETETAGESE